MAWKKFVMCCTQIGRDRTQSNIYKPMSPACQLTLMLRTNSQIGYRGGFCIYMSSHVGRAGGGGSFLFTKEGGIAVSLQCWFVGRVEPATITYQVGKVAFILEGSML